MSLVSCLKHPSSCFSSHFCFLVIIVLLFLVLSVLFLVAVINLHPRYVVFESLYRSVNAVFNAGKSSSSFFSWHIQSVNVISGVLDLLHDHYFSCSVIIIIIIISIYSFRVFHISINWWFFTGVWVTASLLKSPGLFSVFWPFSVML